MSLEQNNLNKEEENKISLNKNDFIKQKNQKEADNPHQKKKVKLNIPLQQYLQYKIKI